MTCSVDKDDVRVAGGTTGKRTCVCGVYNEEWMGVVMTHEKVHQDGEGYQWVPTGRVSGDVDEDGSSPVGHIWQCVG